MSLHLPLPITDSYSYQSYQRQRQLTLGDLLLENRIVFLQGEIYTGNANEVVMKLLYWRPKRYYVEHLLFLVHNHAFVFLALAITGLLTRIPVVGGYLGLLEFAVWIYMIWYIFRAMRVYYTQSRALTFAKYVVLGVAYLSTSITVLMLTVIYSALTLEV